MLLEGEGAKITATPIDRAPPSRPADVKAEKTEGGVLITWKEIKEKDLAGYNLFRIDAGKAVKLNKEPVKENRYMDRNMPETRYLSYYVTSVDRVGNESEASREVIVIVND
jgi:hypothetical protein